VDERGHALLHNRNYLSYFQPKNDIRSPSFGSSILPCLDAADLLGDLRPGRDLVGLGPIWSVWNKLFKPGDK
jgi:hypothetical protein